MGIDDLVNKAKEQLDQHSEQVDGLIDKAAALAKEKTPDSADGLVDTAAQKAKDML